MEGSNETIADILKEMRYRARSRSLHILTEYDERLADRIEAAWKREEKHAAEQATRHAEAIARWNCRDCVRHPRVENYEGDDASFHDIRPELSYSWNFVGLLPGKAMSAMLMQDLDRYAREGRLAERMDALEAHGESLQEYAYGCCKRVEIPLTRRWLEEFRRRRASGACQCVMDNKTDREKGQRSKR